MSEKNEKNKGNSTAKAVAGGITATVLILLVAVSNAIGYIANAITDPNNWYIWGFTALIVFVLAAIIEAYKDKGVKK